MTQKLMFEIVVRMAGILMLLGISALFNGCGTGPIYRCNDISNPPPYQDCYVVPNSLKARGVT